MSGVPTTTLSQALVLFPNLVDEEFSSRSAGPCVCFWGASGPRGEPPSADHVHEFLKECTAPRPSEYNVRLIAGPSSANEVRNVVVEFASSERARRVAKRAVEVLQQFAVDPGLVPMRAQAAQHWPVGGVEWAAHQTRMRFEERAEIAHLTRQIKEAEKREALARQWQADPSNDAWALDDGASNTSNTKGAGLKATVVLPKASDGDWEEWEEVQVAKPKRPGGAVAGNARSTSSSQGGGGGGGGGAFAALQENDDEEE